MASDSTQQPKAGDQPAPHRAGFVALLGHPNAGKSTLVNALAGEKLAAVSGLPQTTRSRLNVIVSSDSAQVIFVDLPGLVTSDDRLNEALRARVLQTLEGVDVVVHLVDTTEKPPVGPDIASVLARVTRPVVLALNKIDRQGAEFDARAWIAKHAAGVIDSDRYRAIVGVSAKKGTGKAALLRAVEALLPEGPELYDPEQLTDTHLRDLAAELIREKVFVYTHQEVPYATAVEIERFEERDHGKSLIAAVIHVERDTQKGIIIGKGGAMLKKISQAARAEIEHLVGSPFYLEIHVKVSADWRNKPTALRMFGYAPDGARKVR